MQICEEIPGIDAVCPECVEKALESYKFIEQCKNSTNVLHQILDNVTESLNVDIEQTDEGQSLYVVVGKDESKLILMDKQNEKEMKASKCLNQKLFVCQQCNIFVASIDELTTHNLSCHDRFTCKKCHQSFVDQNELELHEQSGHLYKCSSCNMYKNTEDSLKEHQDKIHTTFICKECGKTCKGLDRLQAHEAKHTCKCMCPKCGKTYITKDYYNKHVKLCMEDQLDPHPYRGKIKKSYFCEKCGKGYSTPGGLRVHERFVHGNAQPHVCEHCGKKFTAPSYLKIHMVTHTGEKKYKCDRCGNSFVSKEALLYHTRRHTGERPYSCKLCDEKFVNASARAEHMKFKHNGPTLPCEICKRKFFTASFLRQHMNRHNDPSSKLYAGRNTIPPNVPGKPNMRIKSEYDSNDFEDQKQQSKVPYDSIVENDNSSASD